MYSVILMAALTTNGPDAVAFGRRGGCWGCAGGCAGWACSGCSGCSGCNGCSGGCYGGCDGCWGSGCAGCVGWGNRSRGWGYGGWHSTTTYNYYPGWACSACYGGCYGSCMGCTGHFQQGCYGGCYGSPIWYGPGQAMPASPTRDSGNPMTPPAEKPAPKPAEALPGSARLIIDAPSDANLFIDNVPFRVEPDRQFATPNLAVGQTYYYTVRVEMVREGKPVKETRRVLVRANETVRESFGSAAPTAVVSK